MKKLTTEEFIKRAKQIHGDRYDYSKVIYVNAHTKVCIICPEHGEFWQIPNNHLKGKGCPVCKGKNNTNKTENFVNKCQKIYNGEYIYSKSIYKNKKEKVCVICPEHGEFWISPEYHLDGNGCPKCKRKIEVNHKKINHYTTKDFISLADERHNSKYIYSKSEYINSQTKVCIICPEHGEFWQTPHIHLADKGCPKCNQSHLERDVMKLLEENHIKYEYQKRFEWLGRQSLDFYLPDYNIAIECQGIQHFEPIDYFGGEKTLQKVKYLDENKYRLCDEKNINIIYYIKNNNQCNINQCVVSNVNDMIKLIK